MAKPLLREIYGQAGYSDRFSIEHEELQYFRDVISQQWLARIAALYPEHVEAFRSVGIEKYHTLSDLVSHEDLWSKDHRVLSQEAVATLSKFRFVEQLRHEFGQNCRISNVVLFSGDAPEYPEVYWRLVRPGMASDVGALHADKWFHHLLSDGRGLYADDETTIKMWLAIYTEPELNGLYVVPGSHRKTWRVRHAPFRDGHFRPSLDEPLGDYSRYLVPAAPGQAVLFSENLLHGGAVNAGTMCRVSVEITFILKKDSIPS